MTLVVLNIDGKDVQKLIINKNIFTYEGVWEPFILNMGNAAVHNSKLGGTSLGAFNEDYAKRIQDGSFKDLWVGDYFTVNGHKYKIAGFNYKANHEENKKLGNHLIMLTDTLGAHPMNASDTTQGGFAGSEMFKQEIPVVENQLATDFGKHLLAFRSYLSTSIDSSGAPNGGQWFDLTACLCNSAMWFGPKNSPHSNNQNGTKYNWGDEDTQLPIMQLSPDEQKSGSNSVWLRDVVNSSSFVYAPSGNGGDSPDASYSGNCVRTFFLID